MSEIVKRKLGRGSLLLASFLFILCLLMGLPEFLSFYEHGLASLIVSENFKNSISGSSLVNFERQKVSFLIQLHAVLFSMGLVLGLFQLYLLGRISHGYHRILGMLYCVLCGWATLTGLYVNWRIYGQKIPEFSVGYSTVHLLNLILLFLLIVLGWAIIAAFERKIRFHSKMLILSLLIIPLIFPFTRVTWLILQFSGFDREMASYFSLYLVLPIAFEKIRKSSSWKRSIRFKFLSSFFEIITYSIIVTLFSYACLALGGKLNEQVFCWVALISFLLLTFKMSDGKSNGRLGLRILISGLIAAATCYAIYYITMPSSNLSLNILCVWQFLYFLAEIKGLFREDSSV